MRINCQDDIYDTAGDPIVCKHQIKYLGAMLSDTAGHDVELNRRLAIAGQEFTALSRIWKHCNITVGRKLQIYESHVLSKLMYGLQTIWLSKRQRLKLNGFHYKHLRRILGIPHSYISRIPNKTVLEKSQMTTLTSKLLQHQMIYFGNIARNPDHPARVLFLENDELALKTIERRVGRPKLNWCSEIMKHMVKTRFFL